jgi:hypothetical protein
LITHTSLFAKPLAFICYANILRLLGAMKVLEGCKAFAEGLREIEFKGFLKSTHIENKSFFALSFISYFIVFRGENTKNK